MGKKVLVVGQGGREHALVWKMAQSPEVDKIYAAPGNPGIAEYAECIDVKSNDVESLAVFARDNKIDLTVVGPEDPLMAGIVDRFQKEGLLIFGPSAAAARLEGSKVFAKDLMQKYGIPTAAYQVFDQAEPALSYVRSITSQGKPVVVKVDGLAAGKGVVVATSFEEASQAINAFIRERVFGEAGGRIVIEECLTGEEVSVFAICDGKQAVTLISAQDHKRVFDGDKGPNTGGMGAYVRPPIYTAELHRQVEETIINPTMVAMSSEGCPYQGVLYVGLMITPEGPKVLEYNARFGDPETQVIMPVVAGDIVPILEAAARGNMAGCRVNMSDEHCICVILASGGYPGTYAKGKAITGLNRLNPGTLVFQAGTEKQAGQLVTSGGRVMAVVCQGKTMQETIRQVYQEIEKISFEGMHYRRDIGGRALR
ncbi:phosphoribosylamine--glycine ligase [Syntrophomonas erecta subsp. sporosyntropha]